MYKTRTSSIIEAVLVSHSGKEGKMIMHPDRQAVIGHKEAIRIIQAKCTHPEWISTVEDIEFELPESKVPQVYIVDDLQFTIVCTHCDLRKLVSAQKVCPRCAGEINEGGIYLREEYYGRSRLYYGAGRRVCAYSITTYPQEVICQ